MSQEFTMKADLTYSFFPPTSSLSVMLMCSIQVKLVWFWIIVVYAYCKILNCLPR